MTYENESNSFFDPVTDMAFYLCPECGRTVPESEIARGDLFCGKRCEVMFKKGRPKTYGPDVANYRRLVLGVGIGHGPTGILPTDAEGSPKRIVEWPQTPGHLMAAFDRVFELGIFFGNKAKNEGRIPVEGERMARLRKRAKTTLSSTSA